MNQPLVLGIESSCDETGVGIVRGATLLANTVSSSMDEHVRFGGVIPEIASRAHLDAMVPTLREALDTAGVTLEDVDALAVTSGPGLAGALMVGVCAAKALAVATGKPLFAINHLVAHVGVGLLDGGVYGGELPRTSARCSSRAGTRRSCVCATSPPTSSCSGQRSTMPRARPTTRSRGSSASATQAARHRPHREGGRSPGVPLPSRPHAAQVHGIRRGSGPHRYDWSFWASRPPWRGASSSTRPRGGPCPSRTSPRRSRRRSWTS